jgi:hypothetical protein
MSVYLPLLLALGLWLLAKGLEPEFTEELHVKVDQNEKAFEKLEEAKRQADDAFYNVPRNIDVGPTQAERERREKETGRLYKLLGDPEEAVAAAQRNRERVEQTRAEVERLGKSMNEAYQKILDTQEWIQKNGDIYTFMTFT